MCGGVCICRDPALCLYFLILLCSGPFWTNFSALEVSYLFLQLKVFKENVFGYSPGQGLTLHMMTSTAFPSQGLPPCWAGGLLQVRTLVLLPWPQVREHSSQRDHSDQLPSTAEEQRYRFCYHMCHLHRVSFTSTETSGWILCLWFFKALSPGQGFPWQPRVSVSDPAQWRPPLAGRGLLHCLSLFWDPTPQDTLQGPHSAHSE